MELLAYVYLYISAAAFLFGCYWQSLDNRELPITYHQPIWFSGAMLAAAWPIIAFFSVTAFIRSRF